jgi:hypothetical protein
MINIILLRSISLIKHRIARGFNTIDGDVENTVWARV